MDLHKEKKETDKHFKEKLEEVQKLERELRGNAFDDHEEILGMKVKPLTPRLMFVLEEALNPFIFERPDLADEGHIAQFLWIVRPEFSLEEPYTVNGVATPKALEFNERLLKSKWSFGTWSEAIQDYYFRHTFDLPDKPEKSKEDAGTGKLKYTHWLANYRPEELDMPFIRLLQYRRAEVIREHGVRYVTNPLSDKVIKEWREALDAITAKARGMTKGG